MDAWCDNQATFVQLFKKNLHISMTLKDKDLDVITTWIVIYLAIVKTCRLYDNIFLNERSPNLSYGEYQIHLKMLKNPSNK